MFLKIQKVKNVTEQTKKREKFFTKKFHGVKIVPKKSELQKIVRKISKCGNI